MVREHDRLFNSLRNRLYGQVFPFVITGVCGGIKAWGKYRDSCGDPWKGHAVLFVLYLYLSLPLIWFSQECERVN